MSFDYGQRHQIELESANNISTELGVIEHKVVKLGLSDIGGSALTDESIDVPQHESDDIEEGIPVTYVPARNTVFLSLALGWAEVLDADAIFIGVNAVDYSGYPDCRPEYIEAFQTMANLATKTGVEGKRIEIKTPLIHLSKAEIIQEGSALGVDYSKTLSCYTPDSEGRACVYVILAICVNKDLKQLIWLILPFIHLANFQHAKRNFCNSSLVFWVT